MDNFAKPGRCFWLDYRSYICRGVNWAPIPWTTEAKNEPKLKQFLIKICFKLTKMIISIWKLHDFLHTIGLLELRSTNILSSKVDIFLNNGSLNLKNHQTSKIWSISCLFIKSFPKMAITSLSWLALGGGCNCHATFLKNQSFCFSTPP